MLIWSYNELGSRSFYESIPSGQSIITGHDEDLAYIDLPYFATDETSQTDTPFSIDGMEVFVV